jgi:hypothetical protein
MRTPVVPTNLFQDSSFPGVLPWTNTFINSSKVEKIYSYWASTTGDILSSEQNTLKSIPSWSLGSCRKLTQPRFQKIGPENDFMRWCFIRDWWEWWKRRMKPTKIGSNSWQCRSAMAMLVKGDSLTWPQRNFIGRFYAVSAEIPRLGSDQWKMKGTKVTCQLPPMKVCPRRN